MVPTLGRKLPLFIAGLFSRFSFKNKAPERKRLMGITAIIEKVFGFLQNFFAGLPYFDKWFTKSPEEKVKKVEEGVDDLQDEFIKNGGRNEKK